MNNANFRGHKKAGDLSAFTLTEILVVLAIISILSAVLLAVFSRVKESTRTTTCQNNLRQIGLALEMYVNDHGSSYPHLLARRPNCEWTDAVASYVKSTEIFTCPVTPHEFYRPGCPPDETKDDVTYHFDGSYLLNAVDTDNILQLRKFRIRNPGKMILVIDGRTSIATQPGPGTGPLTAERLEDMGVKYNHRNGSNALFADGHTKWLSMSALSDRSAWTLNGNG